MFRVVLIDDEAIIVEGLRKVIRWEEYDCQIVGTAGDGVGGAELISRVRPDILFMDICMPGIDGLGMLAGLRSEFRNMQVTILTGFRDFAYAQEAIRLGVTRFLLKPSKMSEIQEALQTMTEKLNAMALTGSVLAPEDDTEEIEENSASNFIVNSAVEYIRKHYAEKLTLQSVAESCYVSQWHLSKLLGKHIDKNFYDVLNEIRINEAKRLLRDPGLRIGSIGEMVGYTDGAHFARTFKKMTGHSAAEYRKNILPQKDNRSDSD